MAEPTPTVEKAEMYVLGELSPRERTAFEANASESSEVATTVRELEEGAIALATAAPVKAAPQFVWRKIEDEIAQEANASKIITIFFGTIRNGWAAAAVILIGWMMHAFYMNRVPDSTRLPENLSTAATETIPPVAQVPLGANDIAMTIPSQRDRESIILSNQFVGLQRQVQQLSQSVTQQQALLNDASRIKFHNLRPAGAPSSAAAPTLSPALQRALFLAMARELGWLPSTNETANSKSAESMNVEFVDLRSEQEKANLLSPEKEKKSEPQPQPKEFAAATSQPPAAAVIPAFVSGENLVVAIDDSIAPVGSQIEFFSRDGGQPLGSIVIGEIPIVLTLNNANFTGSLFVTSPSGESSVIELNSIRTE